MNSRITVLFFLLSMVWVEVKAQSDKDTHIMFRDFVYGCLDSFKTISPDKQKEIHGIMLVSDLEGNLISYEITFSSKKIELSKKECDWLFCLLSREDYKKYKGVMIRKEELEDLKELRYSIRYLPKSKR